MALLIPGLIRVVAACGVECLALRCFCGGVYANRPVVTSYGFRAKSSLQMWNRLVRVEANGPNNPILGLPLQGAAKGVKLSINCLEQGRASRVAVDRAF